MRGTRGEVIFSRGKRDIVQGSNMNIEITVLCCVVLCVASVALCCVVSVLCCVVCCLCCAVCCECALP
jgi:hypothetical protein